MATFCPPPSTSRPAGPGEPRRAEQARALCLRLLTTRARSRAELATQLAKRGFPEEVSTQVLDRLATAGLVNDTEFAEQWVRSGRARAGKGRQALAAELRGKGVGEAVIAAALAGVDADAERARAAQLVRAKLRRDTLIADDVRISRRLVAMLARRGYGQTLAYSVVSAELDAERERRRV